MKCGSGFDLNIFPFEESDYNLRLEEGIMVVSLIQLT